MRRSARQRTRPPYRRSEVLRHRKNRRKPNYLLLFSIFVIVSTVSGLITYALTSPTMNVAKVDIKGVRLADRAAIERAANATVGRNIILVRTRSTIARVARLSEVKVVKMGRRYPDTLWLRVWERKPQAALVAGSAFYLVDREGLVYHRFSGRPAGVPLIHVTGDEKLQMGKMIESQGIRSAMEVVELARQHQIKLDKISVDPQGRICLNMGSDFRVFLGYPEEIARKMLKLRNALAHKPSMVRDGSYIDLSCPTAPAWRPKPGSPTAS